MIVTSPVRLNVFQRLIRRWETVHPYNAAQAMQLRGQADVGRWQGAWDAALGALGMGWPVIENDRLRLAPLPHRVPLTVLSADMSYEAHISEEMNRPFGPDDFPLRPFIKQIDGSYYAGLTYQHWLADSVAVRMVLREWFARMFDPGLARDQPVNMATKGYWAHFGPHRVPWALDHAAWTALRQFSRFRSVRRLRSGGSTDYAQTFIARSAPRGIVAALSAYCRRREVKLNDLFLAAMMEQCARLLPYRMTRRRRDLALGTIVDLRRQSPDDLSGVFGLFLGFSNVIVRDGDLGDFPRLVQAIHRQNQLARQSHAAAASTAWLGLSLLFSRGIAAGRSYHFFRKHMPLAGGISNVNMNGSWAAAYHPDPLMRYVRASPTGPMIPVAFTPTTLGDDLQLALTYRRSVLDAAGAERMMDGLIQRLDCCAGEADRLGAAS